MKNNPNKTTWGGTLTTQGFIRHLSLCFDGGVIDAPVRVVANPKGFPIPETDSTGAFVYAIPGGLKYTGALGVFNN